MNTMRYVETKKSSKGVVFAIVLFIILGCGIIYFAMSNEQEPVTVGSTGGNMQSLIDVEDTEDEIPIDDLNAIEYNVKDKKISDSSVAKFKSNMTLPVISIDGEELSDLNSTIESEFTSMFNTLKESNKNADNSYTYAVSYSSYNNIVNDKRVLSITTWERINDNQSKSTAAIDRCKTYNIDMKTKKLLKQSDVLAGLLGSDYKSKIKDAVKNYVVNEKKYISEAEYKYTCTGIEEFYIKDGVLHLIFNEDDLVKDKYMDITIE